MRAAEWNEKAKTRVRIKFEMELDVHTTGETSARALSEAMRFVTDSFTKQELTYRCSYPGVWVEDCEISKISCVPLAPTRYEPEEPAPNEA
jgi:hypothetical protein